MVFLSPYPSWVGKQCRNETTTLSNICDIVKAIVSGSPFGRYSKNIRRDVLISDPFFDRSKFVCIRSICVDASWVLFWLFFPSLSILYRRRFDINGSNADHRGTVDGSKVVFVLSIDVDTILWANSEKRTQNMGEFVRFYCVADGMFWRPGIVDGCETRWRQCHIMSPIISCVIHEHNDCNVLSEMHTTCRMIWMVHFDKRVVMGWAFITGFGQLLRELRDSCNEG